MRALWPWCLRGWAGQVACATPRRLSRGPSLCRASPYCVESVAWISEQQKTLSLAFYLLSAWAYLGFSESRRGSRYAVALILFCAALGTKSVTATLPAALLVILWWTRGRLEFRRDVLPLAPWFAAAGASGLLTAWVERHVVGAQGAGFDLTFAQRLLVAGRALWFYLCKLLAPADLMFIYPRWSLVPGDLWAWVYVAEAVGFTAALSPIGANAGAPSRGGSSLRDRSPRPSDSSTFSRSCTRTWPIISSTWRASGFRAGRLWDRPPDRSSAAAGQASGPGCLRRPGRGPGVPHALAEPHLRKQRNPVPGDP